VVDIEPEVARNFTWAILGMEDGKFWHLGGVTRWNSQILIHTWTFLAIVSVASQLFLCLFWISLWLKNRCVQHPCFKNLCRNSYSNAQHFRLDLLTHSWFLSMLFALPGYQFPYTVMNRRLYLRLHKMPMDPLLSASKTEPFFKASIINYAWAFVLRLPTTSYGCAYSIPINLREV
jgi:hypothetical protein